MAIKYVYILVSDETDCYLEQALMSITSLKIHMPNAFVSLLTDDSTGATLSDKRRNILNFVDELKIIKIDSKFNKKMRSRWLKTSMRKYIEGDFFYIDCDTIISEDLSDIEVLDVNLGAVLDYHITLKNLPFKELLQNNGKMLGFNSTFVSDKYFNTGIIFCRDTSTCHNFFYEWHRLWLHCVEKGIITDQLPFNHANYLLTNQITELDGKWNCQIVTVGMLRYLHTAKVLHYFYSIRIHEEKKPYLLANQCIFENIKKTITINQELKNMLVNPKYLFVPNSRLAVRNEFDNSKSYIMAKKIFGSKFGVGIELMLSLVYKFKKLKKAII